MQRGASEVLGPLARRLTRSQAFVLPSRRDEPLPIKGERRAPLSTSPPNTKAHFVPFLPQNQDFRPPITTEVPLRVPQTPAETARVSNLIEKCLELYMTEEEIISFLQTSAAVPPEFTRTVLKRLESQNEGFFQLYRLQLRLKEQICHFNQTVSKQAEIMAAAGVPLPQAFGLKPPAPRVRSFPASPHPSPSMTNTPSSPFEYDSSQLEPSDLFDWDAKMSEHVDL